MEGFVITGVLKPLNLSRRVDGVSSAIIPILMHDEDHFTMIGMERAAQVAEVGNLQGIYPLKDEWVFGCSLETRLVDQTKTHQLKWLWSKDSMNSTINQRLVEQTQEITFKLEGSGGSTLSDTWRKQYLSSSDE